MTSAEVAKDRRLKSIYCMSLDEYNAKLAEQKYKCVLCHRHFTGPGSFTAYVDHDHKCCPRARGKKAVQKYCGKCNRGLLCFICNKWAIGLMEKFSKQGVDFRKAIDYIDAWDLKIKEKGGYAEKNTTKKKRRVPSRRLARYLENPPAVDLFGIRKVGKNAEKKTAKGLSQE